MNMKKQIIRGAIGLALTLVVAGCSDMANPIDTDGSAPADGKGLVRVSAAGAGARTALPGTAGLWYTLNFTRTAGAAVTPANTGSLAGTFELDAGDWTLTVTAFANQAASAAPANAAARGSAGFTVTAGQTRAVTAPLAFVTEAGTGILSYAVTFPGDVDTAILKAAKLPAGPSNEVNLLTTASGSLSLGAGYYQVEVVLENSGSNKRAYRTEIAHIGNGLTTALAGYTFAEEDFAFTSALADLVDSLNSLEANDAETPYTVRLDASVTIDTVDTSADGVWATVNNTVQTAGKYVILDLSACTAEGNTIAGYNTPTNNDFNIIGDNPYITGVILPDTLTNIGDYTFLGCSGLTGALTIPDGVTSIGYGAFLGCSGLTSMTIGAGVTGTGGYAFELCSGLTAFTVAAGNTTYAAQDGILYNKAKKAIILVPQAISGAVTLPDTLDSIGEYAFSDCSKLTSVTIGDGVTSIGDSAFSGCSGLTAFTVAAGNTAYAAQDGILYNKAKTTIILVPQAISGAVTLPDTLTSIELAFFRCSGLTSVTIGSDVTSIKSSAFAYCSGLTSVTIGDGVTSIGDYAFNNCYGLTEFTVAAGNTAYAAQDGILYNKAKTTIILVPQAISGAVTLPDTLTSIGEWAFSFCSSLTSVTIGDSVTSIGDSAFANSGLTSVTIGNGVISIGQNAFSYCSGLTSVTIGDSVTSIGSQAFSGCGGLTSVIIGDSVISIGDSAFYDCSGLTSVTLPASLTTIGSSAFSNCTSLTSVTLPASLTTIGSYAFYYCSNLASVTVLRATEPLTTLGSSAFYGTSSSLRIYVPTAKVAAYKALAGWKDYASKIWARN
jgi:hypothetical protein